MLRHSFGMVEVALLVEDAVRRALAADLRTADILQPNTVCVSTRAMGDAILRELEQSA
jgi:3-isopropylmalate dehydrogenase